MRTPTTVWAVSLALLSGPLSIIADAAPAPFPQRHGHQRRYLIPVRRQASGMSFSNLSGPDPDSISSSSISSSSIISVSDSSSISVPSDPPQAVDPSMPPFISSSTMLSISTSVAVSTPALDPSASASPTDSSSPSSADSSVSIPTDSVASTPTSDSSSGSAAPFVILPSVTSASDNPAGITVSSQTVLDPPSASSSSVDQPLIVGLNTILTSPVATPSSAPSSSADPNIISNLIGQLSSLVQSSIPTAASTGSPANAMNPDQSVISSSAPTSSAAGVLPIIPIVSSTLGSSPLSISVPADPVPTTLPSISSDPPPVSIPASVVASDPPPSVTAGGTGLPIISVASQISDNLPLSIPTTVSAPSNPGDPTISPPILIPTGVSASFAPSGGLSTAVGESNAPSGLPISAVSAPSDPPKPVSSGSVVGVSSASLVNPSPFASQNVVQPTATDSQTALSLPSNILVNSSPAASATLSPNAPKVLQPPGGTPTKQADETLVQIGFNKSLNYVFVSSNSASAGQIFTFLPQGVSDGLGVGVSQIRIQSIQPYDTLKQLGFVTTLALLYVPSTLVDKLSILLHTPSSGIYTGHPMEQVNEFMPFINPSIALLAGQTMGDSGGSNAVSVPTASPGSQTGGSPFGPDSANTEPVRTSSAVIAGPVTLAGLSYAVAMVFVARRYRARRRQRQRTSSQGDPVWMAGGRSGSGSHSSRESRGSGNSNGRSIRSQEISAPVMAQNSLGWN